MSLRTLILVLLLCCGAASPRAETVRVKDLGKMQGWRENALVGYGLVTGLAGTGDSPSSRAARQALSNVLSQFNLGVPPEQLQARNVAVVTVTASLPPFAREGDRLDITVASAGDARSLLGGALLLTPLNGPDGRVHALAQGALSVGGWRYDANGNAVQKNHPTVGSVPNGAVVELAVAPEAVTLERVTFVLAEADYTTAQRVVQALNRQLGEGTARALDASGIDIHVPAPDRDRLVEFLARVENVAVEPDRRARVVINERTGTVVAGADVRISKVAISHGDLKISIARANAVSQPAAAFGGPGIRTEGYSNTRVDVDEPAGPGFLNATQTSVADLVQSLNKLKTPTRDVISILRAIKAAGALHAELVVQ